MQPMRRFVAFFLEGVALKFVKRKRPFDFSYSIYVFIFAAITVNYVNCVISDPFVSQRNISRKITLP